MKKITQQILTLNRVLQFSAKNNTNTNGLIECGLQVRTESANAIAATLINSSHANHSNYPGAGSPAATITTTSVCTEPTETRVEQNSYSRRCPFSRPSTANCDHLRVQHAQKFRESFASDNREITGGTTRDGKLLHKSFEEIPSPSYMPFINTAVQRYVTGGASYLHKYVDSRHQQLGSIYKEKLGYGSNCPEVVFIADEDLMQTVYMNEGEYPMHMVPEAWTLYNELKNVQRGLFFMNGPEWREFRSLLNKMFLSKSTVSEYTSSFNQVITDLINYWSTSLDETGAQVDEREEAMAGKSHHQKQEQKMMTITINRLEEDLYKWSIESLGTMIFGNRLGCVSNPDISESKMKDIHKFVDCVQQIFVESAEMMFIPAKWAQKWNLPTWKRFVTATDNAISLARGYVEENIRDTTGALTPGGGILHHLKNRPGTDVDTISRIIVDLFIAAADTTSHCTQWALYMLAKHPECQERLYNDIKSVVENDEIIEEKHLQHLLYVKGIIKETLRLYPVAPFVSRIVNKDLVLGGYHIPPNVLIAMSLYTAGRDEKRFPQAHSFKPERWLRQVNNSKSGTYACLPFGHGARSCIGKRVAEVQMQLLLARTIQKFVIHPENPEEDIDIKLRMITTPEKRINIKLEPRRS